MEQSVWLYPFLLFIFNLQFAYSSSSITSSAHNNSCPRDQSLALLQFKKDFNIDSLASTDCDSIDQSSNPKTMSWNRNKDCCKWDGVTCDGLTGHVIGLDLSCSQLQGTLHYNSSLFQLSHLQRLNLAYNDFSLSQISAQLGRFAGLTHLNLSTTQFSGQMPPEILQLSKLVSLDLSFNYHIELKHHSFSTLVQNFTQLRELSLSNVNISSVLPMNLSSTLSFLDLSSTDLHGKLPGKIFHLPNLQTLDLGSNLGLTGYLPKVNLSNNSPLWKLDLSSTSLLGELPDSIGYLRSLNSLQLSGCKFSGPIPESLGNLTQITVLDLSVNNFSGKIPPTISNLEQLTVLDFSNNNLEGQIPNFFARLRHLKFLSLRGNSFNGPFPASVADLTELTQLDLSSNSLTGPIPSNIAGLQSLTNLMLFNNSLDGTVPSWLFAIPSLMSLYLHSNRFTGPLDEFQYESLEYIDLSNNKLSGPFPQSISKLVNLNSLYLPGNNLTGVVELEMFSNLVNLQYLDLSYNNLLVSTVKNNVNATLPSLLTLRLSACKIVEFPDLLRTSDNLQVLDLCNNQIRGQMPNWVGSMWRDSLSYLNLSHNFITSLGQLPWKNLGILGLQSNLLHGPFPSSFCNLSALEILDLSNNSLGGAIPQCLGNFSDQLTVLDLRMNDLRGTIPTTFAKGNRLRNIDLHGNQLEGTVPRSLANCRYLQVLDLGRNQINDTFPWWLETLPDLHVLVLRSNRFHGSITNTSKTKLPFPNLRIIDISQNQLTGLLPGTYFKHFKGMMNLGKNNMTLSYLGERYYHNYYDYMTVVMKGLEHELGRILTDFTVIDLSRNKFEGEIPNVIGSLNLLRVLNLSHNNLVGHIPSVLGNLSVLESLDLSSNQLVGEIPEQLTGLNFLAVLNLSRNHLVGPIPQGKQFNTFQNDSYIGNSALCGDPLSKNCGDNETTQSPPVFEEDDSDFASGFTWKVVLMGYGCGTLFGLVVGFLMFFTGKPKWFTKIAKRERHKKVRRPITGAFEREQQRKMTRPDKRSHNLWKRKLTIC